MDEIYTVPEVGTVVGGTLSRLVHMDFVRKSQEWVGSGVKDFLDPEEGPGSSIYSPFLVINKCTKCR